MSQFSIVKSDKSLSQQLNVIGEKLVDLRKKKGYTSYETFAYDFDLPRVHYWKMEKGRTNFTLKSLIRVLEVHDLDLIAFFDSMKKVK